MGAEKSRLAKETGYSGAKINKLEGRYDSIRTSRRDRFDTTNLHLRMKLDFDMSQILCRSFDRERTGDVSFGDFVLGIHSMGPGSKRMKAEYLFRACDLKGSGYLIPRNVQEVLDDATKFISLSDIASSFLQVHELLGGSEKEAFDYSIEMIQLEAQKTESSRSSSTSSNRQRAHHRHNSGEHRDDDRAKRGGKRKQAGTTPDQASASSLTTESCDSPPLNPSLEWQARQPMLPKAAAKVAAAIDAADAAAALAADTDGVTPSTLSDPSGSSRVSPRSSANRHNEGKAEADLAAATAAGKGPSNEKRELVNQHRILGSFLAVALVAAGRLQRVPSVQDCMSLLCSSLFAECVEPRKLTTGQLNDVCLDLLPTLIPPVSPSLHQSVTTESHTNVNDHTESNSRRIDHPSNEQLALGEGLVDSSVTKSWHQKIIQKKSFLAYCNVYAVKRYARLRPQYDPYGAVSNYGQSPITIDLKNLKKTERDIKKRDQQREEDRQKARQKELQVLQSLEKKERQNYRIK